MKKRLILALAICLAAFLTGCGAGKENPLVSKEPFPEFVEVDTEGNSVSSDIFGDYDATIVNFWNNGCGTCIEEMPELEEMYQQFTSGHGGQKSSEDKSISIHDCAEFATRPGTGEHPRPPAAPAVITPQDCEAPPQVYGRA